MTRRSIPIEDRVGQVTLGVPNGLFEKYERLSWELGLSTHELLEALLKFTVQDLEQVEIVELLREHVRFRGRKRPGPEHASEVWK